MFSQKVEYALRAVAYLASKPGGARTVEQIAKATKVSPTYLAKVVQELVHGGVARSQRGIGGGITLAKPATELTMLEVVNAVDPIQRIETCPLDLASHGVRLCPLHKRLDNAWRWSRTPSARRRWPRSWRSRARASRCATSPRGRATAARHRSGGRPGRLIRRVRASALDERSGGRIMRVRPKWRNWQTRQLQELVLARVWRFESSLRHSHQGKGLRR